MTDISPRQDTDLRTLVRDLIEEWLQKDPNDPHVYANNAVDFAVAGAVREITRIVRN